MKKLLVALAVSAAIALAVVAVLVLRFDPESLGARLIEQVNRQSGIRLEAESFSLHPLRGLELIDAKVTGRLTSGDVHASVALMRMKHRVLPLLWGELVVDEILLQEPTIELLTRSAEEMRHQRAARSDERQRGKKERKRKEKVDESAAIIEESDKEGQLRLSIKRLGVEDGSFSIRSPSSEEASFKVAELNLVLTRLSFDPAAPSSTEAVSGEGRFSTGRMVHGDLEASQTRGQIRLTGGEAVLTELNLQSANADLIVNELIVLLLQEPPSYTLEAAGGLNLNGVLGFEEKGGFGRVAIDLGAEGEGPEMVEMDGKGTLTLNAGSIPGVPSVVQIEELVGKQLLTGRRYERTEIAYRLTANKLVLAPFEMVGEGANIGGTGEIDLAGPLDLDVFVKLSQEDLDSDRMDESHLASLADDDGMVKIPFAITGTVEDPRVGLEWDGMKDLAGDAARNWAEQALDDLKTKASEWLREQGEKKDDGRP